jgi:uncharacterized protein YecE (DUF72 family)
MGSKADEVECECQVRLRQWHASARGFLTGATVIDCRYSGTGMETHVGCSGWFYWHWRGIFYPDTKRTDTWFKHYLANFDTVELNAPFYKWPKDSTVKAWRRNAPSHFRYSVKVNQLITHEKRLRRTGKLVAEFCRIEEILGQQLGCFLFQFPPSYRYTASRLKSIVTQLHPRVRNAIEFRHKSWWRQAVYRAFKKRGLIFCSVSGPRLPDELIKTGDVIYLRFHGRTRWYRHDYDLQELSVWADRIRQSGASEAWIYFNNDREGFAIKNAQTLRDLLGDRATS